MPEQNPNGTGVDAAATRGNTVSITACLNQGVEPPRLWLRERMAVAKTSQMGSRFTLNDRNERPHGQ